MPRESTIQVYRSSVVDIPTGLTFGELAYSDVNGRLFVGRTGGSSLWIGAGITTGSISTNSSVLVPTQSAVKTYVDGVVGGGSVVNNINGTGGNITITGDGASLRATVSGTTTTFSNRLATNTLTGVAYFDGFQFSVAADGKVTRASNTAFVLRDEVGDLRTIDLGDTVAITGGAGIDFVRTTLNNYQVRGVTATSSVLGVASFNASDFTVASGAVSLTSNYVRTFNGLTGTVSFAVPVASASTTGVASFGNQFVVSAAGAVSLTSNYVISVNGSTGAVTGIATTSTNTFTGLQTMNAGLTTNHLYVTNGATFAGGIAGTLNTASQPNVTSVGTLTRLDVGSGGISSAGGITGTLNTAAQTNITSVGTLTRLDVGSGGISSAGGITGTLNTAAQPNVTSVGTLSSLGVSGLITASGGLTTNHLYVTNGATFASRIQGVGATFTGTVEIDTGLILPNGQTITSAVSTFNGISGAVSFAVPVASASVTGVASFNATRFTVSAGGAVDLASAFQVTGDTVVAGNAITATRSGNSVTIDNNGVRTFNGATGAITLTGAGGAILFTQSGAANTVNARTASTSLTGVASFNSASFDVSAVGDVTIKTAGVSNTQLANSSVTVAAGGNSTLSLGNTLTFTGGATPNIVFSNTSNTVTATLANDIVIPGNLTVNGTVVTANVDSFIVEDPLFMLGTGNAADSVDLGFYAQYTPTGGKRFTGLFRDASDSGKYKFFTGLSGGVEPTTTVNDGGAGYAIGTIVANIDGGTF